MQKRRRRKRRGKSEKDYRRNRRRVVTQGSLLAAVESKIVTPEQLIRALTDRGWTHRAVLALEFACSVRAIRDAAEQAHGAILSGNDGLKLTVLATKDEMLDATGRLRSQASKMQQRASATERVWTEAQEIPQEHRLVDSVSRSCDHS